MQQINKNNKLDNEIKEQAICQAFAQADKNAGYFSFRPFGGSPRLDREIRGQADNQETNATANDIALRTRYIEEQLASATQNRTERKKFAKAIFILTSIWLILVFAVVICQGLPIDFNLPDSALITMLAGSSANIIGLMVIVIRYLFSPNSK